MKYWFVVLLVMFGVASCKKQSETLVFDKLTDLYPLQLGKVFIYRMDSATLNFGSFDTAHYLVKDSVTTSFLDNQGRTSYIIYRYLTDTLNSKPYQYNATMYATFDQNKVEYVDANNLRFITLVNPVSLNTSWNGNSYIGDSASLSITQNTSYSGWVYQYIALDQPYTVRKGTFPKTCTVLQVNDSTLNGQLDYQSLFSKTYSVEVYADSVGLIYKEFTDYFFQYAPPTSTSSGYAYFEDGSFGIKMTLVDYR